MIKSAVLLAAGRGTRLRPHTDKIPKPLLPVNGRPTLDFVLQAVTKAGVERVCIVTHHLEEQIIAFVEDGSRWNLQASFAHQNELRGNGDALMAVPRDWIRDEPVVVIATDYILEENALFDLIKAHENSGAAITMSLKECPREEMLLRSTVQIDSHWRVIQMIEKPKPEEILGPYAASILFILPPAIWEYLPKIKPSARGEIEMQSAINQMIQDGMYAHGLHQPAPLEWTSEFNR